MPRKTVTGYSAEAAREIIERTHERDANEALARSLAAELYHANAKVATLHARAAAAERQARTLRLCLQILLDDSEPAEHWHGPLNEYVLLSLNAIEQARAALARDAGQEGGEGD